MSFEFDPRGCFGGTAGRQAAGSAPPGATAALEEEWGGRVIDEFVRAVAEAADARAVERALTRAAGELTGIGSARLVPNPRRGLAAGIEVAPVASRRGARIWGWLAVDEPIEEFSDRAGRLRRRLETLGMIAGGALDRLAASAQDEPVRAATREADSPATGDPCFQLHDEAFLHAVLPLFFSQAKRYSESLAVLYVAIDRIDGIRALLGTDQADRTARGVGAEIAARVRASDFVARLDDDRLAVVLPRAQIEGALVVAEKLRRAVAEKAGLLSQAPGLTLSIGAAACLARASDLADLYALALSALATARARGGDRAEPPPARPCHGVPPGERGA